MTITQKDMNEFKTAFLTADKSYVDGVDKAKNTIGEKEDTFQLAVVDLGHAKLSNKSPTPEEAGQMAQFIAEAKSKLKDGDKRKISTDNVSSVKSRLKSLIWCGAHNCKAELEAELSTLMAEYAKKKITGKKVQNVRQSLYGSRMRNNVEGVGNTELSIAARNDVLDKALKAKTDKASEDKRKASLTAVERAAELILVSISRAMSPLSPNEKTQFDSVREAVEALGVQDEVETPEPPVPSVAAPAPVAPKPEVADLSQLLAMAAEKLAGLDL